MASRTASFSSGTTATPNGYTVKTSAETDALVGTTDTVVSESIDDSSTTWSGKKLVMGIDITVAYADVKASLVVQASHNGTDWVTIETLTTDTKPNVTGVTALLFDGSSYEAPYYRLHFNPTGLVVGTSGKLKMFHAYKQ